MQYSTHPRWQVISTLVCVVGACLFLLAFALEPDRSGLEWVAAFVCAG
jgi:hypothetical protein